MTREELKQLIDKVPDSDIDLLQRFIIRLIPPDTATADELEAIQEADKDIKEHGTIDHNSIDWN